MDKRESDFLFPVSDTIPGPDAFEAEMVDADDESKIPVLRTKQLIDSFGHGTAQDIPSTAHTENEEEVE